MIVSGEVIRNGVAGHRIEMRPTARITGNVEAPVLVMEAGARFDGHCRTTEMGGLDGAPRPPALDGSRHSLEASRLG